MPTVSTKLKIATTLLVLLGSSPVYADEIIMLESRAYENEKLTNVNDGDSYTLIEEDGKVSQVKIKKGPWRGYEDTDEPREDLSRISYPGSPQYGSERLFKGLKISKDKISVYKIEDSTEKAPSPVIQVQVVKFGNGKKLTFKTSHKPTKDTSDFKKVEDFKLTVSYENEKITLVDESFAQYFGTQNPYHVSYVADFNEDGIPDFIILNIQHESEAANQILYLSEKDGTKVKFKKAAERYNLGC